ncbi:MAG: [Fe-Fe] hydrogenase large subunit C-terminal domain-containing protein [Bacteroidales bacterium]|nr:[Fe-Fe] hydrogenase large subunit C-terminal domain-containing protein [Bacteroidales bacterium]MDD4670215.1 [Fe-Fe] hydrogenase large subunit C-terminal domain-containing protein [Bacteroidales bacterium]
MDNKGQNSYYRGLEIMADVCIGCSHCMKVCPTEALRVSGGKATIHAEWCIDCGNCYRVCPTRAIRVVDDDFEQIYKYEHRILLVPSLFYSQFEDKMDVSTINNIIGEIGFTEVCPVEIGVDYLIEEMNKYIDESPVKPVISSYCPAIVRLIQVRFPSLVDNIMTLLPPLEIAAQYHKNRYVEDGVVAENVGIFYLTPCVAKIVAVKDPVGGYKSPITGVINMDLMYSKVLLAYKQKRFGDGSIKTNEDITSNAIRWASTKGEANATKGVALSIDGISHAMEFLEKVENGDIEGVDFIELRGCDESCAGGILVRGNRFLVSDDLHKRASVAPWINPHVKEIRKYCAEYMKFDGVQPRAFMKYGSDIKIAIKKMEDVRNLKKILPGIDCGACGAPSCEALADDIVSGERELNNCVFMQVKNEKAGTLQADEAISIMEKIWGKKYDS